jgi:hypothetical protein
MATVTAPKPRIWPFFAWAAVGAGVCLSVLAVLSIGLFVLPVVIAGLTALLIWPGSRTVAALGVVSGLGLIPLVVAYLNRGGPGNVCTTSAASQSCTTEWSPWPWFAAGLALVTLGAVAFALLRARLSPAPSGPPPLRPGPG